MKTLKFLITSDLIISLLLLLIFIFVRFTTQKDLPVLLSVIFVILVALNIGFCLYSLNGIKSGKQELIQKLWISYFVLIFGFLIIDFIAGQTLLQKSSPDARADRTLHHVMLPNKTSVIRNPLDYYSTVKINNISCRGEDVSEDKPDETVRILMLGDSFTMGIGVNDKETFSELLESMLNESGGKKYEVINCGVNSYSPIIEYLQLKGNIDFIKPDIVILNFDMSDLTQEYSYYVDARKNDEGEVTAIDGHTFFSGGNNNKAFNKKLQDWIKKNMLIGANLLEYIHKHSVRYMLITFENVVLRASQKVMLHTLDGYDQEEFNKYFSLIKESLTKVKELCDTKGCEFILTTYPWGHQVNDWEWTPGRYQFVAKDAVISDRTIVELEKFTRDSNIKFVNTFPDFRNYKGDKPLYYKHDIHWTKVGHEVMATSLKNFLDTEGINK